MYIQFLVEDISGSKLIDIVMKKYRMESQTIDIDYDIRPYKGIGGIPNNDPFWQSSSSRDERSHTSDNGFHARTLITSLKQRSAARMP